MARVWDKKESGENGHAEMNRDWTRELEYREENVNKLALPRQEAHKEEVERFL